MRRRLGTAIRRTLAIGSGALALVLAQAAGASTAYGTLNNFDCVNDTGVEAHGFEIELDGIRCTDITYTYDYNHYGVPRISEDLSDPANPRVFVRYAASKDASGNWTAYTAIPSGPISPTDGHQFTNPSVNFGGEHFGVGYYGAPTAVKYNWLIEDGAGNLVHGPPVNVSTPSFTYYPPAPAQPAQVAAVIVVPEPPPELPALQFGDATWVKAIKTTTHSPNKVELTDLVDPDPDDPTAHDWTNGEPAEVEIEWRILQTEFADLANPKGELQGAPEELPDGDEVITRRYEFYKYVGPLDAETGEAMADEIGPDGLHGVGTVTYADHFDFVLGEWVTVTVDLSTLVVVGEFFGAQMSAFDVAPAIGLIDHIPDGELGVPYFDRTVVIAGDTPFLASISGGALPDGMGLDEFSGVFSGTPTAAGAFTFTVDVESIGGALSKTYTVTIPAVLGTSRAIATSASPAEGGTTVGDGEYEDGTQVTVIATHAVGYAFVAWTENGVPVSAAAVYPFTVNGDRTLVANFVRTYTVATSASPPAGGTTTGDWTYDAGESVTVNATAEPGYAFVAWKEDGTAVSASASYAFVATANRTLVASFVPTYTVATSASPASSGTTAGGGTFPAGDVVTVTATPNAGYVFVHWTEGGAVVDASAAYAFPVSADRVLVAVFVPDVPVLAIRSATAVANGSKVDVTVVLENGGATAPALSIDAKQDARLGGKATKERAPMALGDLAPGGTATTTLTFAGVKAGTHTLEVNLTYTGGAATLTTEVVVP